MAQADEINCVFMIRIAITGPESTGKSWLAERLADHYRTTWVTEYARNYLENLDRPYTFDDILTIAQNQFFQENNLADKTRLLFCDTDFSVTYIWCMVKYGKCHNWIVEKLQENHYDLYLLCDIDLPWQFDALREHPEMRSELLTMYHDVMVAHGFNYRIVKGQGEQRLQNAISFVNEYLSPTIQNP